MSDVQQRIYALSAAKPNAIHILLLLDACLIETKQRTADTEPEQNRVEGKDWPAAGCNVQHNHVLAAAAAARLSLSASKLDTKLIWKTECSNASGQCERHQRLLQEYSRTRQDRAEQGQLQGHGLNTRPATSCDCAYSTERDTKTATQCPDSMANFESLSCMENISCI